MPFSSLLVMTGKSWPSDDAASQSGAWEQRNLDEIGSVVGGGTPSRGVSSYWNGEIPWATPSDVTSLDAKCLFETQDRITAAGLDSSGARLLPPGALLVTTRATLGAVAVASVPLATNQGFKSVVCGSDADPNFYYHVFKGGLPEIGRRASGTTFLEISGREFQKIRVPAPPLSEQRRIAEMLDMLDQAIRGTDLVVAKLEKMRHGLLRGLLSRGVDKDGSLRRPTAGPTGFKESRLGQVPADWDVVELRTATHLITKGTTPTTYGHSYVHAGIPFLRVENLAADGSIDFRDVLAITPATHDFLRRSQLEVGDVLISIAGTIGRTAVVRGQHLPANCNQALALVRPEVNRLLPDYARAFLASPIGQRGMRAASVQLAQANLSLSQIANTYIAIPPIDEQERIGSRLGALTRQVEAERRLGNKLASLKVGLSADLLAGPKPVYGGVGFPT